MRGSGTPVILRGSRVLVLSALLLSLTPTAALAHGGQPVVRRLELPPQLPGEVWAVTDTQGLYIGGARGFRWLCEDGVGANAGVRWVAPLGAGQARWLLGTAEAVFLTTDRGCSFGVVAGVPPAVAASPHPERLQEVVLAGADFGASNDLYRSQDAGRTWGSAGVAVPRRFTSLVRARGAPEVLYATYDEGALRSDDGGASFGPVKPGPEGMTEFTVRAAVGPDVVLGVGHRFPETLLARSSDGGRTWTEVATFDDFPVSLALDEVGRGLATTVFDEARRSEDGGQTWRRVPQPVERLGCLRAHQGRLWGCTNTYFGGPWVIGVSEDFGETWTPVLGAYAEAVERWPCVREAPTRACCQHLCPGREAGADCPGRAPAPGPSCPDPVPAPSIDTGVADPSPTDMGVEVGPLVDGDGPGEFHVMEPHDALVVADRREDAGLSGPTAQSGGGGCGAVPGPPGLLLLPFRRSRSSRRDDGRRRRQRRRGVGSRCGPHRSTCSDPRSWWWSRRPPTRRSTPEATPPARRAD